MRARTLMAEREQARPKVNDYLLSLAVAAHEDYKKLKIQKKGKQTSSILHQPSSISPQPSAFILRVITQPSDLKLQP